MAGWGYCRLLQTHQNAAADIHQMNIDMSDFLIIMFQVGEVGEVGDQVIVEKISVQK